MIILASASPRRREILEKHGIDHVIIKPDVDETIRPGFSHILTPEQTAMFLALKKGQTAYKSINKKELGTADIIISADTIVFEPVSKRILGKPEHEKEAFQILNFLKNKMHYVITGVAVTNCTNGHSEILSDTSEVYFKNYGDDDIRKYIDEEAPYDKAGSYAIQSSWKDQVYKIKGDRENIIGLPWYRIDSIISK